MVNSATQEFADDEVAQLLAGDGREDEIVLGEIENPFEDGLSHAKISYDAFCNGVAIPGGSGYGRSTLMKSIFYQMAQDGHGFCYIDFKGDEIIDLLRTIPERRLDDVEIIGGIRFRDAGSSVDLLELPSDKRRIDSDVIYSMLNGDNYIGPSMDTILDTLLPAFAPQYCDSISDIHELFTLEKDDIDEEGSFNLTREEALALDELAGKRVTDPDFAPIVRLLRDAHKDMSDILDNDDSVSLYDAVSDGKIVLVSLSEEAPEVQNLVSQLVIAKLFEAVKYVQTGVSDPSPFGLGVDEVEYVGERLDTVGRMLSSEQVNMPCAVTFQYPSQLAEYNGLNAIGNANNYICFSVGAPHESEPIFDLMGSKYDEEYGLASLDLYETFSSINAPYGEYVGKIHTYPMVSPERGIGEVPHVE